MTGQCTILKQRKYEIMHKITAFPIKLIQIERTLSFSLSFKPFISIPCPWRWLISHTQNLERIASCRTMLRGKPRGGAAAREGGRRRSFASQLWYSQSVIGEVNGPRDRVGLKLTFHFLFETQSQATSFALGFLKIFLAGAESSSMNPAQSRKAQKGCKNSSWEDHFQHSRMLEFEFSCLFCACIGIGGANWWKDDTVWTSRKRKRKRWKRK